MSVNPLKRKALHHQDIQQQQPKCISTTITTHQPPSKLPKIISPLPPSSDSNNYMNLFNQVQDILLQIEDNFQHNEHDAFTLSISNRNNIKTFFSNYETIGKQVDFTLRSASSKRLSHDTLNVILSYLPSNFVVHTCSLICKDWKEIVDHIPLDIFLYFKPDKLKKMFESPLSTNIESLFLICTCHRYQELNINKLFNALYNIPNFKELTLGGDFQFIGLKFNKNTKILKLNTLNLWTSSDVAALLPRLDITQLKNLCVKSAVYDLNRFESFFWDNQLEKVNFAIDAKFLSILAKCEKFQTLKELELNFEISLTPPELKLVDFCKENNFTNLQMLTLTAIDLTEVLAYDLIDAIIEHMPNVKELRLGCLNVYLSTADIEKLESNEKLKITFIPFEPYDFY